MLRILKKKSLVFLVSLSLASFAFSGCKEKKEDETSTAESTPTTTIEEQAAEAWTTSTWSNEEQAPVDETNADAVAGSAIDGVDSAYTVAYSGYATSPAPSEVTAMFKSLVNQKPSQKPDLKSQLEKLTASGNLTSFNITPNAIQSGSESFSNSGTCYYGGSATVSGTINYSIEDTSPYYPQKITYNASLSINNCMYTSTDGVHGTATYYLDMTATSEEVWSWIFKYKGGVAFKFGVEYYQLAFDYYLLWDETPTINKMYLTAQINEYSCIYNYEYNKETYETISDEASCTLN